MERDSYLNQISPPKDDILFHERQLLANEPVLTQELLELQEQKELEMQYQRIASKLAPEQQAILQLHTGIKPLPPEELFNQDYRYTSLGLNQALTGCNTLGNSIYDTGSALTSNHLFGTSRMGMNSLYSSYQKTGPLGGITPALRSSYSPHDIEARYPEYSQLCGRDSSSFLHSGIESCVNPRYSPPVKRFLLTKDPKDRRLEGNGLGMKVTGGREIPGSGGRVCGYVSKIYPSGVVDKLREVNEGDLVLEWNGVPLLDRTDSEVQRIIDQSTYEPEVQIVIRNDVNMVTGMKLPDAHGKVPDFSTFRDHDWYSPGKSDLSCREYPAKVQRGTYDINGNRYNSRSKLGRTSKDFIRDGLYGNADKNYNYNFRSNYDTEYYKDDYGENTRTFGEPYSRYYDNRRDHSFERRKRRGYSGERELPSIPAVTRRHSWDTYDESGYSRGQYWRSCYGDDDYSRRPEGNCLRTRYHSDPNFRSEYSSAARRWHSQERYPDEYRNRYLPDVRNAAQYCSDDPRERRYGSAQYLDYSSRRYREEFEHARKDLDRFQRHGSFKDYGNRFRLDRYDGYRDNMDCYGRNSKANLDDGKYLQQYDSYRTGKDTCQTLDRYKDTRVNRCREDERLIDSQERFPNLYDHNSRRAQLDYGYYDGDRYKDSSNYNIKADDRYYGTPYRSDSLGTSAYISGVDYRDEDRRQYGDHETGDRKHRSRNSTDVRMACSPGKGRDRKGDRTNSKSKSRRSKRHQQPQHAEVQLLICHDVVAQILYVTVLRARNLVTLREDGDTRPDPFIKVYLLPGRSLENQRRTRHFLRTSNPEWNQTMVYPNLQAADLKKRYLEVTAWNYDQSRPNEFLGEVVLDLSDPSVVHEEPKWYTLQEMVDKTEPPNK